MVLRVVAASSTLLLVLGIYGYKLDHQTIVK